MAPDCTRLGSTTVAPMSDGVPLICIHNHLLPGVDDGSEDLDMTLELIDQGLADGIGTWVLTPHVLQTFTEQIDDAHSAAFEDLLAHVERRGLPVRLYLASEIMYDPQVAQQIVQRRSATFNGNGRYFLLEFPMTLFPPRGEDTLFECQLAGLTPIVAHPERNTMLAADLGKVARMVDRGILMQVNARSLAPETPAPVRHVADQMVRTGLAQFVATDAHNPLWRPAELRDAYERVGEIAGEAAARRLCVENPRAAIDGERIRPVVPDLPDTRSWWRRLLDEVR